ncbi:MAG: tRNA (adenosine(37)-N6)-threonylcarbamoyltransferase complex transferase subunit TsaD [Candidatus Caenarcaniphilales bacterium]|nr:tRNA (adenosine(37)-N6)-threonylcarbamoyltransferase complex transferase subunit TsaD [Candidatus Caenarcaniphilales bacterium]
MIVLGIETSCDETSVAIVEKGQKVLSNVTFSQIETHKQFGGVVPEIAAREHLTNIDKVIWQALEEANLEWSQIDRIAVVNGPGLVSSLLVGVTAAKSLSWALGKELVSVNHLKAHICANFIDWTPEFPFVCLLASGGHTQLILVNDFNDFELLGETVDDSAGEAFDKVARLLELSYPGGPAIEKLAERGDEKIFKLPTASVGPYHFSFSGLKTAVLRLVQSLIEADELSERNKANIAATFQNVVCKDLAQKLVKAATENGCQTISIAGGVAANKKLREFIHQAIQEKKSRMETLKEDEHEIQLIAPRFEYCTDNGAMVASGGYFVPEKKGFEFEVYSRAN